MDCRDGVGRALESLTAAEVVARLQLEPLDREGGWFRRLGQGAPSPDGLPAWSLIQALFTAEQFSAVHRLDVDEIWGVHAGDPLRMLTLDREDGCQMPLLETGSLQAIVPAGVWQGARPEGVIGWTLVSCICVPGFSWEGFELGEVGALTSAHPEADEAIRNLTR